MFTYVHTLQYHKYLAHIGWDKLLIASTFKYEWHFKFVTRGYCLFEMYYGMILRLITFREQSKSVVPVTLRRFNDPHVRYLCSIWETPLMILSAMITYFLVTTSSLLSRILNHGFLLSLFVTICSEQLQYTLFRFTGSHRFGGLYSLDTTKPLIVGCSKICLLMWISISRSSFTTASWRRTLVKTRCTSVHLSKASGWKRPFEQLILIARAVDVANPLYVSNMLSAYKLAHGFSITLIGNPKFLKIT